MFLTSAFVAGCGGADVAVKNVVGVYKAQYHSTRLDAEISLTLELRADGSYTIWTPDIPSAHLPTGTYEVESESVVLTLVSSNGQSGVLSEFKIEKDGSLVNKKHREQIYYKQQ